LFCLAKLDPVEYTEKCCLFTGRQEYCVFFSITDLEKRKIQFDVEYPPGEIDLLDATLTQVGSLQAEGVAELLSHTLGEVRIKGHIRAAVEAACDRCLEAARTDIDSGFDLFYRPADSTPVAEEMEIAEGEIEIGFYEDDRIELEDVLREFVLLALPMQWVCGPDCKGICPICGQNRNTSACQCVVKPADDRWAALKKLSS
jgi:uncharacterized protein